MKNKRVEMTITVDEESRQSIELLQEAAKEIERLTMELEFQKARADKIAAVAIQLEEILPGKISDAVTEAVTNVWKEKSDKIREALGLEDDEELLVGARRVREQADETEDLKEHIDELERGNDAATDAVVRVIENSKLRDAFHSLTSYEQRAMHGNIEDAICGELV